MSQTQFQMIAVERLHESIFNPRKTFREDGGELVASVRAKGILQPLLVRPVATMGTTVPNEFEVVCGHRRHRAAKEAGLTHLPAIVRRLEDREVLELAISENVERADMTPLEEGCAYKQLHGMGRAVEEIAALVGRTKATIYGRMKLAELQGAALEAVVGEDLHATIGLLVARQPTPKAQDEAFALLKEKTAYRRNGLKDLRYDEAVEILRTQFNLKLREAPFDTKDPDLVAGCGACTGCPKRTGANPDLFTDVKADTCLDRPCYQAKARAHTAKVKQEVKEKADETGIAVLPRSALSSTEYVDLEKKIWDDGGEKKVKSVLGKHAPEIAGAVVDKNGRVHHLVKAADAEAALKKAKKENLTHSVLPSKSSGSNWAAEEARRKAEREFRARVEKRATAQLVVAAEKLAGANAEKKFLQVAIEISEGESWRFGQVAQRRGMTAKQLEAASEKYSAAQLRGLFLELLLCEAYGDEVARACKVFGLDFKKIEAEEKAASASAEKPAPAKKAPAKKKGRAA